MNPAEPEQVKDDAVEAGGRSQAPPTQIGVSISTFRMNSASEWPRTKTTRANPARSGTTRPFNHLRSLLKGLPTLIAIRAKASSVRARSRTLFGWKGCWTVSTPRSRTTPMTSVGWASSLGNRLLACTSPSCFSSTPWIILVFRTTYTTTCTARSQRWTWATVAHAHSAQVGSGDRRVREPSPTKNTRQPKGPFLLCVDG